MRIAGITLILAASLGLLSCGQKGPLQLPQEVSPSWSMPDQWLQPLLKQQP